MKAKALLILMASFLFAVTAAAQSHLVTLQVKEASVESVLNTLKAKYGYSFVMRTDELNLVRKVTVNAESKPLEMVMAAVFEGEPVSISVQDKTIIITKAPPKPQTQSQLGSAQDVRGIVVDENREPIIGAGVFIKGTKTGTTTNLDGFFSIPTSEKQVLLVISFMGYKDKEISLTTGADPLIIQLEQDRFLLEELVVVGYGSAKKISSVVGAATTVKSAVFQGVPGASSGDVLQGQVAGLQVYSTTGEPSSAISMRLRGVNSINASNTPLFILDGAPVDVSIFVALNPNDIENMTVLKDASSTAIYGSRAANGVVYITTKKGTGEKPTVTISGSYGISNVASYTFDLMNSEEYFAFRETVSPILLENEQFQTLKKFRLKNNIGCDWRAWILRENAPTWKADVTLTGRTSRSDYFISLGAYNQQGIEHYSDLARYNIRSNVNVKVTDWLKMGMNLGLTYQDQHTAGYSTYGNSYYNPLNLASWNLPYTVPYEILTDAQGNFTGYGEEQWYITDIGLRNYFYIMDLQPTIKNIARLNGNMYQEITPFKGFTIRTVQAVTGYDYRYTGKILPDEHNALSPITEESFERFYRLTSTNTAEYKFALGDNHHFDFLLGHESIWAQTKFFSANTSGQTDDRTTNLNQGTTAGMPSYNNSETAQNSLFSRLSYDYESKYYADITFRRDGSSLFGQKRRYANFYSIGAMWSMKNEAFLKDIPWVNTLQLKASYGTIGNSGINNYLSLGLTGTGKQYNGTRSWYLSSLSNPNLTWETLKVLNIGINTRLWDRLGLILELYNKTTQDMLMYIPYSYQTGFPGGWGNVGKMRNRGIDIEIKYDFIKTRDMYFGAAFNMNYNRNVITELYDGRDEFVDGASGLKFQVGKPYGEFYLVEFVGVDPVNGKSIWLDKTGNYTGTYSESNARFLGKQRFAPWSGGLNLDFSWKGISVTAAFSGVFGKYMENYDRYFLENPNFSDENNMTSRMKDIWTKPGQITQFPAANEPIKHDSRFIDNASFVRLKNFQIGYAFANNLVEKTKLLHGAKVYMLMRNYLTFTKYQGYDPEVDAITASGNYPNTKQLIFGLEFTF